MRIGLVVAALRNGTGLPSPYGIVIEMTWKGHDFLDATKDETVWDKARQTILKPAAGIAFDVLVDWLKAQAKLRLGIS